MHELIFLLPELTIFVGTAVLLLIAIRGDASYSATSRLTTVVVLAVTTIQVALIARADATSYLSATFGADRFVSFGQIAVLVLAILFTTNLNFLGKTHSIEVGILTLLSTLFAMVALSASNWLLVLLSLIGVVWAAVGVAAQDEDKSVRSTAMFKLIPTTLVILLIGFFSLVFLFASTNGINLEQIEKFLAKTSSPTGAIVVVAQELDDGPLVLDPGAGRMGRARGGDGRVALRCLR